MIFMSMRFDESLDALFYGQQTKLQKVINSQVYVIDQSLKINSDLDNYVAGFKDCSKI